MLTPRTTASRGALLSGSRPLLRTGYNLRSTSRIPAGPDQGTEDISEALKADLERYKKRQLQDVGSSSSSAASKATEAAQPSGLKETVDKVLIADFFLVLAILAWLAVGVATAGLNGGSSPLLDTWYVLWPILWQPAIGVLMAGALVSGGLGWLRSQQEQTK
mmetsp:Transcript_16412/g.35482  ORF Transcript_16412/g.35482 Transcript_16412/m.35482 type:complete len:162 (+) Transcript_16412:65-550(+)|eukprot:CAMPEP_0202901450 /NCGR_PEP_ID=MMETSP1392-20130828/14262_1 /ASSEMBLY_ACC=CAM_ASM_000868 /TAXON_ID=225041 /ORGANISM="Chlamydomonas chlamydogama, Strain SAG 11-48b" /LENGTH=161 /DNA_ID=CAMNT_0049588011 /DNA_START=30 /DNA_END=515 /DNA_ORIENTATION=+